jgi:hypothetical protein
MERKRKSERGVGKVEGGRRMGENETLKLRH